MVWSRSTPFATKSHWEIIFLLYFINIDNTAIYRYILQADSSAFSKINTVVG